MAITTIEYGRQRPKTLNEARGVTKVPDWRAPGSRDGKERLLSPMHGIVHSSTKRCDKLHLVMHLDAEHPLNGPHPTD